MGNHSAPQRSDGNALAMPGYHARMHKRIRFAAGFFAFLVEIVLGLGAFMSPVAQARSQCEHVPRTRHRPAVDIQVSEAWVRAAPPGAIMLAGYMTLHNEGGQPLRLVSVESDAFGMVEAHRTLVEDGVSRMRPAGDIAIPAHQSIRFAPSGLHLMLMQPTRTVKSGDVLHFRLHFSDGRTREVAFQVRTEPPSGQH